MRCKQCGGSFRISIWVMQCGECKEHYCTKCMKRENGICYCEKCLILITRPPDMNDLMKLKSKDLQDYLNRHNIKTLGLVEKRELAELLCHRTIPVKSTKGNTVLNKIYSNFESVLTFPERLNNDRRTRSNSSSNLSTPNLTFDPPTSSKQNTSNTLPKFKSEATTSSDSPILPPKIPKLTDYKSIDDLTALSAKELKVLLAYNRVDYKGCVEKGELLEKATRLWEDHVKGKCEMGEETEDLCKLCMDAPLDCVLLECGHIATCIDCGKKLAECPICRQYVSRVVRTFKA